MRLLRRIVLTIVITLAAIFVLLRYAVPVALSYYGVKKAPPIVRVYPTDLKDNSISQAPGIKLRYFDYEFEVPWTDLDEAQTRLYPKDNPRKTRVDLHFKSGLRLWATAIPAREMVDSVSTEFKVSPQALEYAFGHDTMRSDYNFLRAVYEFTPDKMNHWNFRGGPLNRDECLLLMKSIVPSKAADSGIFNIRNPNFQGFQQGDPQAREQQIVIDLYSEDGSIEIILDQKGYRNSIGVTQPEINRLIQSLNATAPR